MTMGFGGGVRSSGDREPFTPLKRREISSSLLLLVFHLCPVRARMTSGPQLYCQLRTHGSGSWERSDERDSEAAFRLNGKEVID